MKQLLIKDYIGLFKILIINLYTYYTSLKMINNFKHSHIDKILNFFIILVDSILYIYLRNYLNLFLENIVLIMLLSLLILKKLKNNFFYSNFTILLSLIINNIIFAISSGIVFWINKVYYISNEYIILLIISGIYSILMYFVLKIKKFKNGFNFLHKASNNGFLELVLLNISAIILLIIIILINSSELKAGENGITLLILAIILFNIIPKSIQLYYKQKLLIQDLNETKNDLEIKTKEVQTLEQENLSYSKKAHSLEHKLKSLENKINKLTYNQEISKEIGIDKELKDISNQIHNNLVYVELDKTGIEEIDDMLDTMRNVAIKNNIEFNLQLKGNIYQMTNNYIDKQDLAILLADHIKDAIIAINHTENINKSILVRLGKIDNCFALYIYDTGVEFKKEVLDNLGKIPITTYKEEGGTGMGFMNTFDTLNKTNASLTIKQIGPPSKDNYTKVIMITFDGKHEFKII